MNLRGRKGLTWIAGCEKRVGMCAPISRRKDPLVAAVISCALLLVVQICGCSNSGGVMTQPHVPVFTTIDAPGGSGAFGAVVEDIDAGGDVVGYLQDASNVMHGFVRTSTGTFTEFDGPGAGTQFPGGTQAFGINSAGTIVGYFMDSQLLTHSYIRTADGTLTTFNVPGAAFTFATSINDARTVAGGFVDISGSHYFLRTSDGTTTGFDVPGAANSETFNVRLNAGGAVAGFFIASDMSLHGFLRTASGAITILDAPGAGTTFLAGTQVNDISSNGTVVGEITTGTAGNHSFIRTADGTYTVFDPTFNPASLARGINDSGAIVGQYTDASFARHGYLRNPDGTFVTIDDPSEGTPPAPSGTASSRINSSGAIIGEYFTATAQHGYIRQ
jgi:hypothetical protein